MIAAQTLQPDEVLVIDFPATDGKKDITKRYKEGYNKLRNKGLHAIFLMENDDWYCTTYFEQMMAAWKLSDCPDIFGTSNTIYYHIEINAWFTFYHSTRSMAMSTLIRPDLNIEWPVDEDPYTDISLWSQLQSKVVYIFPELICLGIKHGTGLCGGENHSTAMERFIHDDSNFMLLKNHMDEDSLSFYKYQWNADV
tara:strand:+ start:204 stop:791 length:588 start_codon:yes stop_codon:yes gene_type:complete